MQMGRSQIPTYANLEFGSCLMMTNAQTQIAAKYQIHLSHLQQDRVKNVKCKLDEMKVNTFYMIYNNQQNCAQIKTLKRALNKKSKKMYMATHPSLNLLETYFEFGLAKNT